MKVAPALGSLLLYCLVSLLAVAVITSWRKWWKEQVLFLVSICVALLFAEGALRLFGVHAAMAPLRALHSSTYHHAYPPNAKMFQGVFEGTPIVVRTNEDGLRTRYARAQFLKYQDRIIAVGDSFTFGFGIRQEAAFPERLEGLLRNALPSRNLAVLNAGVISYSPLLEKLQFEGILKAYNPTLVLLFLDATDIGDDIVYAGLGRPEGGTLRFPDATEDGYYGAVYQIVSNSTAFKWIGQLLELSVRQTTARLAPGRQPTTAV